MILLVAIGCFILAALIGGGKDQPQWRKEGFSSCPEWEKACLCGRKKMTHQEESYYFKKACKEWDDPKWTDPEILSFVRANERLKWIDEIAMKMAYDDGYAPYPDMREYDPNNIHKPYWKFVDFKFKKWKEEGTMY